MKFDLHTHTWYSDGTSTVRELVKQAKKIGLNGFAITDHNTTKAHAKIKKFENTIIIRGEEISTTKGHVLAYLINETIPAGLSVEETIEKIHEQGGIAVAAHPFDLFIGVKEFAKHKFDAFEVYNGLMHSKLFRSKKTEDYAKKIGMPTTAGSDSHMVKTLGDCYVNSPHVNSAEELLKNVLKKKTTAHRKQISIEEFVKDQIRRETKCFKFSKEKSTISRIIAHALIINKPVRIVKKYHQLFLPIINTIDFLRLRNY